jgi:hypothetical protein
MFKFHKCISAQTFLSEIQNAGVVTEDLGHNTCILNKFMELEHKEIT